MTWVNKNPTFRSRDTKSVVLVSDLSGLSFSPLVQSLLADEDAVLGSVDQCVKRHKGHDAGQTETAGVNLHTDLKQKKHHYHPPVLFKSVRYTSGKAIPGNP